MNKGILAVIALIIIAIVLVGGAVYLQQKIKPYACTQEAKLCSDGSYVGRTGPNCEFAKCPEKSTSSASTIPEETLKNIAEKLRAGDIESALTGFTESDNPARMTNREYFSKMPRAAILEITAFFERATLIDEVENTRVYKGPLIEPDESSGYSKFIMTKDDAGVWRVSSW